MSATTLTVQLCKWPAHAMHCPWSAPASCSSECAWHLVNQASWAQGLTDKKAAPGGGGGGGGSAVTESAATAGHANGGSRRTGGQANVSGQPASRAGRPNSSGAVPGSAAAPVSSSGRVDGVGAAAASSSGGGGGGRRKAWGDQGLRSSANGRAAAAPDADASPFAAVPSAIAPQLALPAIITQVCVVVVLRPKTSACQCSVRKGKFLPFRFLGSSCACIRRRLPSTRTREPTSEARLQRRRSGVRPQPTSRP